MRIIYATNENEKSRYFDRNGEEIHENDIVMLNGCEQKVYLTEHNQLGTDSTNPLWIESGRAQPCEYGIYPFNYFDDPIIVKRGEESNGDE